MSETARVGRPRATPTSSTAGARDQILDAAAALFAERGYAGTSTRSIAERVGIRQASLYYHFAGKDEMLLELLETSVRPSLAFVERLRGIADAAAALFALAVVDVRTLLATPHNIGALYFAPEVQEASFDGFRRDRAQLQQAYVDLVASAAPGRDAVFLGACCMQLVEMVIPLRRQGQVSEALPEHTGLACLRVAGVPEAAAARAAQLLRSLGPGPGPGPSGD